MSISSVLERVAGAATIVVPWPLVLALVVDGYLVTGVTSVLTTLSATRVRPVTAVTVGE